MFRTPVTTCNFTEYTRTFALPIWDHVIGWVLDYSFAIWVGVEQSIADIMPRWLHLCLLVLTFIISIVCLALLLIIVERLKDLSGNDSPLPPSASMDEDWLKWMKEFNISFESEPETDYRYSVWRKHYEIIRAHNARKDSLYTMGLNQFTHLEHWEFVDAQLRSKKMESDSFNESAYFEGNKTIRVNESLSKGDCYLDNFDWREKFPNRQVYNQVRFVTFKNLLWPMSLNILVGRFINAKQ